MASVKAAIIALMGKQRYRLSELPAVSTPALYAFYVDNTVHLLPVTIHDNGLVYIGMVERHIDARAHFFKESSGFCSFRQTLGAVLKTRLDLKAIPRGLGTLPNNIRNYTFTPEGEERLSAWMEQHLTCSFIASEDSLELVENDVIRKLAPPLNFNGWKNKQAPFIKMLRKTCSREAEGHSAAA